ncbi:8-oxo-dGTP pyrophosphatase MutT (NUDIX family) [Luteibacter sp. Sphag1AF]|uniref:NUDIX hydrolase n=1 Tax=Luteibacter sp. Sphag1AF TaxID=2587031 RepID=UPI0017E5537C|nr:NUDIX hydrolase [Luteibacter sp. Sphag1AF]MBB3228612.1 8-oxo-dGTP pyrophosphatase MutT (NUDIX family) [Luteibacter sp. Sphag1AF]
MQPLSDIRCALADYAARWPAEPDVSLFLGMLDSGVEVFRREHLAGHFTASAWLVSADGNRVLLTHHRKLGRWLQLGGHADGDVDLPRVALREGQEESGIDALRVEQAIFDVDRHGIPARGQEPEHWHYDVRYVVHADDEAFVVGHESLDLAWRNIDELIADASTDASLKRMAHKWRQRQTAMRSAAAPG